jgi:hypothetical protein
MNPDLSRNFGCKLSMGIFMMLLSLFLFSDSLSAQVDGVGGPLVTIQLVPVCDDGTTAFAMMQSVIGQTNPTLLKYIDAEGNDYTIAGAGSTLTAGYCVGDSGTAAADLEYNVLTMCDDGTPFYRLLITTNGTPTTTDYELDLTTTYTPSGTVDVGPCYSIATASLNRTASITTGTIAAGAFSYTICNTGLADGTVTVNGVTSKLIPGSCTSYRGYLNPVTRKLLVAPEIGWNATNTVFDIITEN